MTQIARKTALRQIAKQNLQRLRQIDGMPTGRRLRPSRFNILVALADHGALLFNSMTRALCRLSPTEVSLYRQWCAEGENPVTSQDAFVSTLASDGFLVVEEDDELEKARRQYFAARNDPTALMLTIAPTMACNLACGYCFQGLNKDLSKIDTKVPDAIYDLVQRQKHQLKSLNMTWYGGEPLMGKDTIFQLSDRLIALSDKHGIAYSAMIVSNGYLLDAKMAQQLYSRRCTSAQITVDGLEDTHDRMRPLTSGRGSFERIMHNVGEVLDHSPMAISLRINVGNENLDECSELLEEFARRDFPSRGAFSVYFAPIAASTPEAGEAFEQGLSKLHFNAAVRDLTEGARKLGMAPPTAPPGGIMGMCVAAREKGYVITPNGDMHKCWETAHDSRKRVGTIFDPSVLDSSLNAEIWRNWSPFDSETCKNCKILPMCGGFCGQRFVYFGAGDEHQLPCPEWKWNTAEYLFARAREKGVVTADDWLPSESTVTAAQSGERHSAESLEKAQQVLLERVSSSRDESIDRDYLLDGDGRFFEAGPLLRVEG